MRKAIHLLMASMLLAPLSAFADGETSLYAVAHFTNTHRTPRAEQLPQANNAKGERGPVIDMTKKTLNIAGATVNLSNISGITFEMREVTGIKEIKADTDNNNKVFNVYSIDGRLVRQNASSLEGLSKGIYIANGKKILVK